MSRILIIGIVLLALLLAGCTQTVAEITEDDSLVGETVAVKGTVESTIKIGDLSGYTLVDKNNDKIIVGSKRLPAEGDTVTARGTLEQGLFGAGYYISVE